MKKLGTYLVIFLLLIVFGCKKSEEQKASESNNPNKPASAQKKKHPPAPPAPLEVYQEDKLVTTVQPADYPTVASAKITVGDKEFNGIALKDLLAKYKLKGKTVVLGGPQRSVAVTWEQATAKDVYVVVGPHQFLQISAPKTMNISFPARLIKIRASDKTEDAALATEKQKTGN
jgi:hypothetical protein